MLEQLFKFPIVMIDGDNEDRKTKESQRFGDLPNAEPAEQGEYDMIFGEAEYPYYDLIGIEDKWLPSKESFQNALNRRFEACVVRFVNVGSLLVPWSKKKFKTELIKFAEEYEATLPPRTDGVLRIKTLTKEEAKKILEEDGE